MWLTFSVNWLVHDDDSSCSSPLFLVDRCRGVCLSSVPGYPSSNASQSLSGLFAQLRLSMSDYQPPSDEKVPSYYISHHQSPNQDHWHSVRPSEDDVEAGILPHPASSTPPPPYDDPGYDSEDDDLLDSCGIRGKKKVVLLVSLFSLIAWVGLGGPNPYNPTMWWYYGADAEPFFDPVEESREFPPSPSLFVRPLGCHVDGAVEERKMREKQE